MKNVVIFGYGHQGLILAKKIYADANYKLYGFADNSVYKQGYFVYGEPIKSIEELKELHQKVGISVIVASKYYPDIIKQLEAEEIPIEGVYRDGEIKKYPFLKFELLDFSKGIHFYAGDIRDDVHRQDATLVGLSINCNDEKHIYHDIRNPYPIPDNVIERYEAEEVLEYIEESQLVSVLNEIYRILKPGGWLRISMPDFYSPYIKRRTMTDKDGKFIFDAGGGGVYGADGIVGGHVYFSTYDNFCAILEKTHFKKVDWLCYYSADEVLHKKHIDMEKGYLNRVRNDSVEEDFCMIVDCYK